MPILWLAVRVHPVDQLGQREGDAEWVARV